MAQRWSMVASSVEEAVARALREKGPDTLLVSSRRMTGDRGSRGMYEVVFELDGDDQPAAIAPAAPVAVAPQIAQPRPQQPQPVAAARPAGDRKLLKSLLGEVRQARQTLGAIQGEHATQTVAGAAQRKLRALGFSEEIAREFADEYARNTNAAAPAPIMNMVSEHVASRIQCESTPELATAKRVVVALVGPAGSGKTTTLAKLAARYGALAHRSTLLIGADTNRLGACDQLQSYASALGASYAQVDSAAALFSALEEHRTKELVLIDVPGISPREPELAQEWADVLSHADFDVHLVLPATTRYEELSAAHQRFAPMNPRHLVFTHLDEIRHGGGVLSLALQTQLPVSFLCAGQGVPEDIEPASNSALARLVGPEQLAAAAAA